MILIINRFLLAKGFKGISLWPFIVIRDRAYANDKVLINHERIHLKQQLEMLILPFYVWYVLEYGIRYFRYKNSRLAYYNISFEREAYLNEFDPDYCKKRKFWAFLKYLKVNTK